MRFLLVLCLTALVCSLANTHGQERIDGEFGFESDPAHKYSLYIPSGYQAGTPHPLMLAMHPRNTLRWNAQSWCDTLIAFAEANNLILVCPDGGSNGDVSDRVDTAFTQALLDSAAKWYSINKRKMFVIGFSVGGKATYTFGLANSHKFAGYIPIGAAVDIQDFDETLLNNAGNEPIYIVHGGIDNPQTRFFPIRDALQARGAIMNSLLMPGINHTIDFPERNQILSQAYRWVDSVDSAMFPSSVDDDNLPGGDGSVIFPNPVAAGQPLHVRMQRAYPHTIELRISRLDGGLARTTSTQYDSATGGIRLPTSGLTPGVYYATLTAGGDVQWIRFIVAK